MLLLARKVNGFGRLAEQRMGLALSNDAVLMACLTCTRISPTIIILPYSSVSVVSDSCAYPAGICAE